MEKYFCPTDTVRCIKIGPSERGKSELQTNSFYSPSLHQDKYQKLYKGFNNYIPIHIMLNNLNEEDKDLVNEERVIDKKFEKSPTEINM